MKKIFITVSALFILNSCCEVVAQTIPVGTPVLEDYYRRQQLLGNLDSGFTFSIRPIASTKVIGLNDVFDPQETLKDQDLFGYIGALSFAHGAGKFQILPLSWQQKYNSDHPYGWNDGAMIPAKGYQTMVSGGFYLKYGPLSIQLRPEFIYANNPSFDGYASGHTGEDLTNYYVFHNLIDQPERYGNSAYNKVFWGQSNIKLTFGPASIGLSNENIWWGPGIRNSLVLTNNAPGFKHLTLNTAYPVKTGIGSFEGQIIAGRLEGSGHPLLQNAFLDSGKPNDWRYFTGININYSPKWLKGLALGYIRTFNSYGSDLNGFKEYFPFLFSYFKSSLDNQPDARDQITSVYARWLFKKAHAEIYFEYGVEDNSYNFKDFIGSPDHSRAYNFGFRKLIDLNKGDGQQIMVSGEITQLSANVDRILREGGIWYVNSQVTYGHTNEGQILGAGTGIGGNIQSFDLSWIRGLKSIGVSFERYEHNVDFSNSYFPAINNHSRKWVDFAFGLNGELDYKNLLFNAKLQGVKSLNYQWILKDYDPSKYYIPNNDVFNLHAELGVTFRF